MIKAAIAVALTLISFSAVGQESQPNYLIEQGIAAYSYETQGHALLCASIPSENSPDMPAQLIACVSVTRGVVDPDIKACLLTYAGESYDILCDEAEIETFVKRYTI